MKGNSLGFETDIVNRAEILFNVLMTIRLKEMAPFLKKTVL